MHHELTLLSSPDAVAQAGAEFVAEHARAAVADRGIFQFAVSGGHTPWAMLAALASQAVPWDAVVIYQVDERVAPPGDPSRNLTHLTEALGSAPATVLPMPVNDADRPEPSPYRMRAPKVRLHRRSPQRTRSANRPATA
jgi:6-phosphogluconolactonase